MTQEEKQLLLIDLCARLPYNIKANISTIRYEKKQAVVIPEHIGLFQRNACTIIPYLRPMSSMTDDERDEFRTIGGVMSHNVEKDTWLICAFSSVAYDWLNKKMFDYRGLIEKGLALEASNDMITEDYVSFETAKLLKEKGFDEVKCQNSPHFAYNKDGQFSGPSWDTEYKAPTLQMAMKWLRENHNIHITGVPNGIGENVFYMGIYRKYDYGWTYISDCLDEEYKEAEFHTPEEACEAAIKYCLENLI